MGRKFGSVKILYNKKKSWAGSISMFVFGFLASVGCVSISNLLIKLLLSMDLNADAKFSFDIECYTTTQSWDISS